MPDLEKAIKWLELERECVSRDCDGDCGQCDLAQDRASLLSACDDAIDLLKAQLPRLMTLEEVKEWEKSDPESRGPVFYEDRILERCWWITHDNERIYLTAVNEDEGRFWTSRPMDEQREATPWA